MNCRVPAPSNSASSLRRNTPKQAGSSHRNAAAKFKLPRLLEHGEVVHRVVGDLLAIPAPAVDGGHAVSGHDADRVDRGDDRDRVVGEFAGPSTGVEAHQR